MKNASVFDVWTTTNFARNWVFWVADGVDGEFLWILVPELTVSFELGTSIFFIVFSVNYRKVGGNPFVDLVFDGGDFFWSHLVVEIEVEADAFGSNIGTFLADGWID